MVRGERDDLAERVLGSARFTTTTGFARSNCPFCITKVGKADKKGAFSVRVATGYYRCWRCGTTGRLKGYEDKEEIVEGFADIKLCERPEGFFALAEEPGRSALCLEPARDYLHSRGVVEQVWGAAEIGACPIGKYANRVVVPVLTPDRDWIGFVGRTWVDGTDRPYLNAAGMALGEFLFNHAALLVEAEDPVLVVEGVFDALALWPHAAAVLGQPKEAQIGALLEARRPVCVVLDGDVWEASRMLALRLRFEGQRAGFVRLPPKVDPDEVPREWLLGEARRSIGG